MLTKGWARPTINQRIDIIRRMFKWAASYELVPYDSHKQLQTVPGLREGEHGVAEGRRVKPVPEHMIDAIRPHVSAQVWALIQLQLYTAARPGELLIMRPMDLDMSGAIWVYEPESHKGQHLGRQRTIYIGPHARSIVEPWLRSRARIDTYLFDPREAGSEARRTAKQPRYTTWSYRKAIARACRCCFAVSVDVYARPRDAVTPAHYRVHPDRAIPNMRRTCSRRAIRELDAIALDGP